MYNTEGHTKGVEMADSPRSGLKQSRESEEFVLGFLYLTLYIYSGGWAETGGRCRDALGWRIASARTLSAQTFSGGNKLSLRLWQYR